MRNWSNVSPAAHVSCQACPLTFPCAAAAATCAASRVTCRRLLASGLSATARIVRRSRIFFVRSDVLDAAGGTDIFQMPPGRLQFTAGADALRCLCFSEKVFRWYADCCKTPIANGAATPRFPVIGVIHSFMDFEAYGRSRDEILGTPLCRIHERSAVGPLPADAPPTARLGIFAQRAAKALGLVDARAWRGRTRCSTIAPVRRSLRRAW